MLNEISVRVSAGVQTIQIKWTKAVLPRDVGKAPRYQRYCSLCHLSSRRPRFSDIFMWECFLERLLSRQAFACTSLNNILFSSLCWLRLRYSHSHLRRPFSILLSHVPFPSLCTPFFVVGFLTSELMLYFSMLPPKSSYFYSLFVVDITYN